MAGGIVTAGMVALEIVMGPPPSDRIEVFALFAGMACLTVVACWVLVRHSPRARSLNRTVTAVGLIAAALVALAVAVGAWRMFLSSHDLHLLSIVLGVAASLAVLFAAQASRSIRADLVALSETAARVGENNLDARTGISRADELGSTAAAFDTMISRLAEAEQQRHSDDEARRALLAAIGHDLRTPLSALQAAIEALQDGLATEPDRYLQSMSRDVDHLRGLVDDLFLLARIEAGDLSLPYEIIDLAELADETVEALEPVARRRQITLSVDTPGRVLVHGGPDALGRVMRNLVDNALRHAPATSNVVVRVHDHPNPTVEVVDQGPGFAPEHVVDAFDSFTRADPSRNRQTGGAGLGLAIAKGVIEAHGGRIWAAPGPGGHVSFDLPSGA